MKRRESVGHIISWVKRRESVGQNIRLMKISVIGPKYWLDEERVSGPKYQIDEDKGVSRPKSGERRETVG